MVTKKQKTAKNHFHPLRIHKKRGILKLSDDQIEVLALTIVKQAEDKVVNGERNND